MRVAFFAAALAAVGLLGCAGLSGAEDRIALEGPCGKVVVDLNGGRILSWRNASGEELLFMPARPVSPDGDWSHGGISLCWPWFGKKGTAASSIHGFARNRRFTLRSRRTAADGVSVTLGLELKEGESPDFPYAADLELVVRMSDRLTMEMRTTNVGTVPFSFSEGFQPYFAVGRYDAVKLSGVKAEPFAAVDGMDAAFPRLGDAFAMSDAAVGREISAVAHGNTSVIVWSPGNVEPHNRNLAAGDTERFIGLGPASRVKEGAVTLPPGASHTLSLGLSCRSLSR